MFSQFLRQKQKKTCVRSSGPVHTHVHVLPSVKICLSVLHLLSGNRGHYPISDIAITSGLHIYVHNVQYLMTDTCQNMLFLKYNYEITNNVSNNFVERHIQCFSWRFAFNSKQCLKEQKYLVK